MANSKGERVEIRLSKEMKDKLQQMADDKSLSLSAFIRMQLTEFLKVVEKKQD